MIFDKLPRHNARLLAGLSLLLLMPLSVLADDALKAVIVGGGFDSDHNPVAIESNVRYVKRILPQNASCRVLFANGRSNSRIVSCLDENGSSYFRAPQIGKIDAPERLLALQSEIERLNSSLVDENNSHVLLYFTGHGSPSVSSEYENNYFDMWAGDRLNVKRLASDIALLPKKTPVVLIMVQCYSGAFGNLIFENGSPSKPLVDRDICGFFASVPTRLAAGCTPEINEANYRDFTSYFVAALTGIDRLGNPVTGADFNHDGRVGMDEAFAYALVHDESIDTPVCTSDTFLRRYVKIPDEQVDNIAYSKIIGWATPSQKAALDGLSALLKISGEHRLAAMSEAFDKIGSSSWEQKDVYTIRFVRLARSVVLAHSLENTGSLELKERFEKLLRAESRNPFEHNSESAR
jgi:hypothetical protein